MQLRFDLPATRANLLTGGDKRGRRKAVKGQIEGSCGPPASAEGDETTLSDWRELKGDRRERARDGGLTDRRKVRRGGGEDISHGY